MFFWIGVVLYFAASVFLLEYTWGQTKRLREIDEERDSQYPAFRRTDAKNWKKWKFYPIGMTALIRMFIALAITISSGIYSWFARIGHDDEQPLTGWRKWFIQTYYNFCCRSIWVLCGITLEYEWKDDYDYSYYLGPDYKKTQKLPKKVSTVVAAPHQTYQDDLILVQSPFFPAFGVKADAKKLPNLYSILAGLKSFFIERGSTPEAREAIVDYIKKRQELIEDHPDEPELMLYPEGTQSNGQYILPFKRGAFAGMKTVRPFCIKYNDENLFYKPQWDCTPFLSHTYMVLCQVPYTVTATILPPLKPNKYLLETHKDKGKTDWEIFAWATRDAMCKAGGFKTMPCENPIKDKIDYKKFMTGKIDEITAPNGLVYKATPMKKKKKAE